METSDDPVTLAVLGGIAVSTTAAAGGFGGKGGGDMPAMKVESPTKTAEAAPAGGLSEKERKNRMAALSALTRNWGEPLLSKKGLTGRNY